MAVPTAITDLSTTLASNPPAGGDLVGTSLDDYLRAAYGFIAQLHAGADMVFTPAGTGAVAYTAQAKGREIVSVLGFAADGVSGARVDPSGTLDSLGGFQAAVNYCQDNLKALYIPGNDPSYYYKLAGTLSITKPLTIVTDGAYNTCLYFTGLTAGQYGIDIDGTNFGTPPGTFEHGDIGGLSIYAALGDCIRHKNASLTKLHDIIFRTGVNGVVYTGTRSFSNDFERLINGGLTGKTVHVVTHTGGGHHVFRGGSLGGTSGVYVDTDVAIDNLKILDANIEQCTAAGVAVYGTVDGLTVSSRFEGGNTNDILIRPDTGKEVKGIVIQGNTFSASDSGGIDRISLGGGAGTVRGFQVTGNIVTHGSNNFAANLVQLNGDGESGLIAGNFLNGTTAGGAAVVSAQRAGVVVFSNENLTGKLAEWDGANPRITAETPFSFTDGSAGMTPSTLTTNAGHYTCSNGMCNWQATVVYPTVTVGGTNAAELSGLPYTPAASTAQGRAGAVVNATDAGIDLGILMALTSGTEIKFYNRQTLAVVTNADLSGKTLYLSGSYAI